MVEYKSVVNERHSGEVPVKVFKTVNVRLTRRHVGLLEVVSLDLCVRWRLRSIKLSSAGASLCWFRPPEIRLIIIKTLRHASQVHLMLKYDPLYLEEGDNHTNERHTHNALNT